MAEMLEFRLRLDTAINAAKRKAAGKYRLNREGYLQLKEIFENVDGMAEDSDCTVSDIRVPFDGEAEIDIEGAYFDMYKHSLEVFLTTLNLITGLEAVAKKDRGEDEPECMIITFKTPCVWEVIQ